MATTTSRRVTTGLITSVQSHSTLRPRSMISLIRRNHHINLRLPSPIASASRRWLIEAVPPHARSSWDGSDDGGAQADVKKPGVCGYAITGNEIEGSSDELVEGDQQRVNTMEMVMWAAATASFGVANRVMYKLALVPLKQYPFFLAQLSTFGYVAVYYSILYFRYRAGTVTDEMLSVPKMPFLIAGVLQALAAAAGMAATANLSGPSTTVLSQTFLVWQIFFSIIFLRRRYSVNQILGCTLVALGVVVSVASGSGAAHSLKEAGVFWILLMVLSYLFQGADTVLKEVIFIDSQKRLKGASLDLFIVNSYGSAFQAICIALLLPFLSKLWGIPFNQLGSYLKDGAACFLNVGTMTKGCEGAPLLPLLFVVANIGYNIALLRLLKISSAVVSSLASTVSVPIAVFLFTLPLPYLGVASSLPKGFMGGTVVLVLGMLVYSWTPQEPNPSHSDSVIPSPPPT
ncbi:CRT (chloroquine-resistance transporter)-like transporter 3 [Raphanus sativus]|uniref:Protein CLT3, chloroplastic n=1 Tax=Raphanus sativus TaxID=3726 RepID=A0A6J0MH80_RAPSA|nr:protein CLT3, chloroplastic [Raphanus sativus]KAJ4911942.1 CRT (chloroquine-resistance transporter)-like transporter 3 [Raphanus sativus]